MSGAAHVLDALAAVSGIVWLVALALLLAGTRLAARQLRSSPPHLDAPFGLYPVSVLKPLKGVDSGLRDNLESFFRVDYPEFELLFSIPAADDPAGEVVRGLMARYPAVRARLFVGETRVGPNPKVNNLLRSYERALHDWVLISDSNVRVNPDYLKRLVAHLEPGVGLVTAIVAGTDASGWGGKLEATYLGTFYARGMCLAEAVGRPCVVGKTMLFQRSVARRFGGVKTLGRYLAEDFMAGEAMRRLGLRVVTAADPVRQVIGVYSFRSFWSRHVRWGRIRRAQAPAAFAIEPLLGCLVSGLLGAFAFARLAGVPAYDVITFHLLAWAACDALLMRLATGAWELMLPLHWFARELLAIPLWLHVASGNTVEWRGSRLTLLPGGVLKMPARG